MVKSIAWRIDEPTERKPQRLGKRNEIYFILPNLCVLYSHPMTLTTGQPVIWLYQSKRGIIPILSQVANVVHDRVVLRVVKKATGEVYFKVVPISRVRAVASNPIQSYSNAH